MVRKVLVLTAIALLSMVAVAFAEANPQVAAAGLNVYFGVVLAAGLAIGIAALGTGIGQGLGLGALWKAWLVIRKLPGRSP